MVDGGVSNGDRRRLRRDSVAMVEGVVGANVGVSEDGGVGGKGRSAADDNFGFTRLRDVWIDDSEMKVLPF